MSNQLKMAQVQSILALSGLGWSQRRIARQLEVDRETVARYVRLAAAKPTKAPTVLNRFLRQGGGLSRDGLDRLCRVLGLQLVQTTQTVKASAPSRKEK